MFQRQIPSWWIRADNLRFSATAPVRGRVGRSHLAYAYMPQHRTQREQRRAIKRLGTIASLEDLGWFA